MKRQTILDHRYNNLLDFCYISGVVSESIAFVYEVCTLHRHFSPSYPSLLLPVVQ